MNARRNNMLLNKLQEALIAGDSVGYKIVQIDPDSLENYYVMFEINAGIYAGQKHILKMSLTYGSKKEYRYPEYAPNIYFITSIAHINISENGLICLDILKDSTKWMPTYGIAQILLSIKLLLDEPNPLSPFNGKYTGLWNACSAAYEQKNVNLDFKQQSELYDACFAEYKRIIANVAKDINKYAEYKYFANYENYKNSVLEHLASKKNKTEVVKTEVVKTEVNAVADKTEVNAVADKTEVNAVAEKINKIDLANTTSVDITPVDITPVEATQTNTPVDITQVNTTPANNKWAKYQKKQK